MGVGPSRLAPTGRPLDHGAGPGNKAKRGSNMRAHKLVLATLLAGLAGTGLALAQPSYPCSETNDNLPNPYRQVRNWASPPRPWNPISAVAVDAQNHLWAVDRCESEPCVPVIELGPDGRTQKNFGAGLFV